ncbi:hypothetical protein ABZ805_28220 [Saccharopolyspora sp. NPDC047091]|uniref:hypothetical protein n=1 Tax=Saccharopolyspora sp. NPDC047091 TaxID=3155924 RepID=UPI003411BAC2
MARPRRGHPSGRDAENDVVAALGERGPHGVAALQRVVGNAAVARLLGDRPPRGDATPVQRTVIDYQDADNPEQVTLEQITARPEFQDLTPAQRQGLAAKVDSDEFFVLQDLSRSIVTGAVSGPHRREGRFLAELANSRSNVFAYDPEMNGSAIRRVLDEQMVPDAAVMLHADSITSFGEHVPRTDVFVPHPGPWTMAAAGSDLAAALDHVLGSGSRAFVLTDNEPESTYAARLQQRIGAINAAGQGDPSYRPLAVEVESIPGTGAANQQIGFGPDSGDVELEAGHRGDYRLLRITRN